MSADDSLGYVDAEYNAGFPQSANDTLDEYPVDMLIDCEENGGCLSEGLPETFTSRTMQRYIPPILIIVGTIGNLILILVMKRKNFNTLSVLVYLRAFIVANTVALFVNTGVPWACFMASQPYIADWTDWGCRLWTFTVNVIGHSPVWFAVGMSTDRYIVVWHPNKAMEVCSVFISKIVIVAMLIGLTAISVHAMWTYELDTVGCVIAQYPDDFHSMAWPWIWDTFYYFLPLVAILVCSLLTLLGACLKRLPEGNRTPNRPDEREATIFSLILSMAFFLLAAPATTVKIVEFQVPDSWLYDTVILEQFTLTRSLVQMISAFNHCVTFFVLISVSPSFRKGVKAMFVNNCYLRRIFRLPEVTKVGQEMASTHVAIEDSCTETTPL